jgi:hypothetical protein
MLSNRTAAPLALALALAFAPPGCKRIEKTVARHAPGVASTVHMSDPDIAPQLIYGFYGMENGAWRWTAQQFAVSLRPPYGAAQKGAALVLHFTVPPVVIEKEKSVTLSAAIGGTSLAPETYTSPGNYAYRRAVPASLLGVNTVRADFKLDKAMPPAGGDIRTLGIVVLSAGLE